VLCDYSGVRGGGKCPEEEHTTCSGGRTINCHKRGLRGERFFILFHKIKKREKMRNYDIFRNNKM
jgi:hypothetical protein